MADFNLHGLNPRDFQHLVQAIARKHIAVGVTAFGDGKDGARDLTYRGRMDYPSQAGAWDGYLVLSCKFNQKPNVDSKKNAAWAHSHLEHDLRKFTSKRRKLPKPDYYIFVTNVSLSGVHEKGGRDRVSSLLETYKSCLPLKDYAIWDYNDLRGFLDGDADLRSAYGHLVTAGDVLSEMMAALKLRRPDFFQVMHTFVQKELITDASAKLQSAGESPESQIALATVFVDLPFAETAEAALSAREEQKEKQPTVIDTLLKAGASVLRQAAVDEAGAQARERRLQTRISRFVIVGGPGQGKSTFGQYLCQLYRAAILRDRPRHLLDERVAGILHQICEQQAEAGGLPLVRRFPIRIELRNFAHALASEAQLSLLEYIRRDIARLGNATLILEDLKVWLAEFPWLLVLDGLDEVPPSSNREAVLREIDSLRVDFAAYNSDVLLVATTRPQSYSKEFSEGLFQHIYLTPLSAKQALKYGRKLVEVRCGTDVRRRDELIRSLEKACKNPATSRLMQSPLQVTIMATLLEETGEPPQQRYKLFQEYYRTIYKRETRRKLLGGILTERQKDIDTIHAHAGLLIHAAGERSVRRFQKSAADDMDSALSDEQFRELVRRRLKQIRISEAKATELLNRISDGSLQRLVFLVRQVEGWVRFDIASLKEFMAAEAVMNGSDEDVRERLKSIAPASYWRNVFLFAVGRCFLEREHLLDLLVSLCISLNNDCACAEICRDTVAGQAAKAVLWGSRLALDILSDGTARQYPGYETSFANIALQLIRLADYEMCARLAAVYHDDLRDLYVEAVSDRLRYSSDWSKLGAWQLLASLADRGVGWALDELNRSWPSNPLIAKRILIGLIREGFLDGWAAERFFALLPKIEPLYFPGYLRALSSSTSNRSIGAHSKALLDLLRGALPTLDVENRSLWRDLVSRIVIVPAHIGEQTWEGIKDVDFENRAWYPVVAGVRFGADPSAERLATELEWLAERWDSTWRGTHFRLPWPLEECLRRASSQEELRTFAVAARRGHLGDTSSWNAAESRWKTVGITDSDFEISDSVVNESLGLKAFPFGCGGVFLDGFPTPQELPSRLDLLKRVPNEYARGWLATVILERWGYVRSRRNLLSPTQFRELYEHASRPRNLSVDDYVLEAMLSELTPSSLDEEWVALISDLGSAEPPVVYDCRRDLAQALVSHFCVDPNRRRGLLPVLAAMAAGGCQITIPSYILEKARDWGHDAGRHALCLSLVSGHLADGEMRDIARQLVEIESEKPIVWKALRIASALSQEQAARCGLALLEIVSDDSAVSSDIAARARESIVSFLTRRPSSLADRSEWERLRFPEPLPREPNVNVE